MSESPHECFEFRPGEEAELDTDNPEAVAEATRFRDVLGRFATGVTVVTSMNGDEPVGLTCQSFASVSLDPPLVLFCAAKTSRAWPLISASGRFGVNVLADDQEAVAERMASRGTDKFAGVPWNPAPLTGTPALDGVIAHIGCTIEAVHDAGDHNIVIGRVQELASWDGKAALTFFRGTYGSLDP